MSTVIKLVLLMVLASSSLVYAKPNGLFASWIGASSHWDKGVKAREVIVKADEPKTTEADEQKRIEADKPKYLQYREDQGFNPIIFGEEKVSVKECVNRAEEALESLETPAQVKQLHTAFEEQLAPMERDKSLSELVSNYPSTVRSILEGLKQENNEEFAQLCFNYDLEFINLVKPACNVFRYTWDPVNQRELFYEFIETAGGNPHFDTKYGIFELCQNYLELHQVE